MAFKVIKENVLAANDRVAAEVRDALARARVLMLNIISSPGSGKTSFLEKAGPALRKENVNFLIITGDCFTSRDAERMDRLGLPVVQINTGNTCHIDAALIAKSIEGADLRGLDLIIVENIGNLVCPAEFDIGEDMKIAFLSTAEGHDKPEKYPLLFRESAIAVINKMDLLGHVDFDAASCENAIHGINPGIDILKMSCRTGEGIDRFLGWIKRAIEIKKEAPGTGAGAWRRNEDLTEGRA